ncbi:hypothetical protein N7490_006600 [Penicillium lividum]|nr:hypothetical protein N7490_006600 [Penicillium lividum]
MSEIESPVSLDCHLDLDVESLWREFDDLPTPPPSLATGHGSSRHQSSELPLIDSPALISCIFHSTYEDKIPYVWPGPDPVSAETCADDIFNYISAHLLEAQMHWIDFRLCRLTKQQSGDLIEQYQFCLPRNESISGNLAWMREQIQEIICRHNATRCYSFQLHMCPRQEEMPDFITNDMESQSIPAADLLMLDPQFFVQNIVENFR